MTSSFWTEGTPLTPSNLNQLFQSVTGIVSVDASGAVGDGVTDDTASIQSAENARLAWQTLKFTPGKTYLVESAYTKTVAAAGDLLSMKTAGTWDFRGATIKFGSSRTMTTGSDGGGLGVINVNTDNSTLLGGTISLQSQAQFGVAYKSQTSQHRLDLSIISQGIEPTPSWSGLATASVDITGTAISGRAKNIAGWLSRPDCPVLSTGSTIIDHQPATALILGGNQTIGNYTSSALVLSNGTYDLFHAPLGIGGIANAPIHNSLDVFSFDIVLGDVGCNQIEMYGTPALAAGSRGLPAGSVVGMSAKWGSVLAFYHNDDSSNTTAPNAWISGGSAQSQGFAHFEAAHLSLRTDSALGTSSTGSNPEVWFTVGLSVSTLNMRSGNTTYYFPSSANTTA